VELGTHDQLVAAKGLYAQLYRRQRDSSEWADGVELRPRPDQRADPRPQPEPERRAETPGQDPGSGEPVLLSTPA
jgi:hypothetical protein